MRAYLAGQCALTEALQPGALSAKKVELSHAHVTCLADGYKRRSDMLKAFAGRERAGRG